MARPRRASSRLGGFPRGDTGAPSLASLASQSNDDTDASTARRHKRRSLFRRWKRMSLKHTWLNPLVLIILVVSGYCIRPGPENPLYHALFLSHEISADSTGSPSVYAKGKHDITFVAFYTVFFTFTREFIMQQFLLPLALRYGVKGRGKQLRFMEQAYTAIYFTFFGPFGLYIMRKGPLWYFNTTAMFEGFPHRHLDADLKAYYLLQASYWCQQSLVLMLLLEKPRKDFRELVLHHIVTIALIALSYYFHFTHIGLAVFITHDVSDFFLATSRTLNYLDSPLVGPYYIFFLGTWIYLRHYMNLRILWATLTEFATVGPFTLDWAVEQYKCRASQVITFTLLACLQALNLFWVYHLLRIAANYVFNDVKRDDLSEGEYEEDGEEQEERKNAAAKKAQ